MSSSFSIFQGLISLGKKSIFSGFTPNSNITTHENVLNSASLGIENILKCVCFKKSDGRVFLTQVYLPRSFFKSPHYSVKECSKRVPRVMESSINYFCGLKIMKVAKKFLKIYTPRGVEKLSTAAPLFSVGHS